MISVINSLLSYLLLVLVIVVLGGIAITLGIVLRNSKNRKEEVAAMFSEVKKEDAEEANEA